MRDSRVDAAKFVLVVMVILGHLLELFRWGSPWFEQAYRFLYMFHMPAFVFLSGMVSSDVLDTKSGRRLLATVVIPLAVFQLLGPVWESYLSGNPWRYSFVAPWWILWYLASLIAWRLMLPLLLGSGMPLVLSIAICLGAGAVPDIGYAYSASRTAMFLPFFVAGHLYVRKYGLALPAFKHRFLLGALLLAGVWMAAKWTSGFSIRWLYGSMGYASLGQENVAGLLYRALLLVIAGCGLVGFFSLAPGNRWMALLGRYSVAAFLLHAFFVKLAFYKGWMAPLAKTSPLHSLAIAGCVAVVLGVVLCLLGRVLKPLFDYGWLWSIGTWKKAWQSKS